MPKVKVIRSSEYINRFRDYGLYIDGKKVGTIANRETMELEVPVGEHTIYAKIDWGYSPTKNFRVADDGDTTFRVGGFKGAKWLMPVGLVFIVLYNVTTFFFKADSLFFLLLVLPTFLALMYFISFGRKNYLTLLQEKEPAAEQGPAAKVPCIE